MPAKTVHAPALCGFAGLAAGVCVPAKHSKDSAAINLLASLTSSSMFDQAFAALPKGNPAAGDATGDCKISWYGPELSTDEASQYCDAVAQSLRDTQIVFELPLIGADDFRRAASTTLEPLLRGESDPTQTLAAMQKAFEAIVDRLGAEAVRDSHRRGLGLSPMPKK